MTMGVNKNDFYTVSDTPCLPSDAGGERSYLNSSC